VDLIVTYITS